MNRLKLLGIMMFLAVCASCQEDKFEQTLVLDSYKATSFDLKYILENADSVSYGTYRIVGNINELDSIEGRKENLTRGGIITGDEYWVNEDCYILVEFAAVNSVSHPAINSPMGNGFCGITATVYYRYYHVYKRINETEDLAVYYTCVAYIDRVTTQLYNGSDTYLLWQNNGTRAYCPSSSYDPVLYPQEWIYVAFQGRIVGGRGFISPYEDTNIEVNYTASFRIPME